MIRETLSAPMLFRREGVIMLDSIQSLLDSLPEGAVLIRQGTAVYINAMARQLLPRLSPGAPLPDFISLPSPEEGRIARVNTSTPMPPIHWVMARQSRVAQGRSSMLDNTVAPVVVKPETVSKKAPT